MLLCLDVGNTRIYGGIYKNNELVFQFRKSSQLDFSSDETGIFLKSVIRENNYDINEIDAISICSVVPDKDHSIRNGCIKYFNVSPFFLQPGVKTGLKIKYNNPHEVGADRIANAIAAICMYPNNNLIVVDFGTATTLCVISKNKEYLGGIIIPGIRMSMEALDIHTDKLPRVEIKKPKNVYGKTTIECIQAGLYHGQIAMVKELTKKISVEAFQGVKPIIIGTGGFSSMFRDENLFDIISPTMVLKGLYEAYKINEVNI